MHIQEIFTSFVGHLKPKVGDNVWRDWFDEVSITHDNNDYILNFPNKFVFEWVINKYATLIKDAANKIGINLKIISLQDSKNKIDDRTCQSIKKFNLNFCFENFIVGKSNMIAYEAAYKVALGQDISFNPLFIHSNVGLGKTHLLHAIANYRSLQFPSEKLLYLSAEQFMNLFVKSIQQKNTINFKEEFRSVDVLLIDDFQFLGSKDATQEEFFHTFNTLLENNKQLVISADKDPNALPGVAARLKSRLGWGLVVDIHQATYELKYSILKHKAALANIVIPDNVVDYLANTIDTSIRELEGAFLKIIKYAEWTNSSITIELARSIVFNFAKKTYDPISLLNIICEQLNISLEKMQSNQRDRITARARQKAVHILRNKTHLSYLQIARLLGNKDHTSIIYAEKQANRFKQEDPIFANDLEKILKAL